MKLFFLGLLQLSVGIRFHNPTVPDNANFQTDVGPKHYGAELVGSGLGAKCNNQDRKLKAAVLLIGMSRSFDQQEVQEAFQKHVIAPMVVAGIEADIFAHLKLGTSQRDDVAKALANVGATDFELEDGNGKYSDASEKYLASSSCWTNKIKANNLMHVMGREFSIQQAHFLMEKHEKETGNKYDFVVISRPDLHFGEQGRDTPIAELNCEQGHMHHDMFAIMPRAHSDLFANLLKDLYLTDNFWKAHPEACGHITTSEDIWRAAADAWGKDRPDFPVRYNKNVYWGQYKHDPSN